jgi:hypothetical protein
MNMLNDEELQRLEEMLAAGKDRSDPLTLSATDQIMDAMMRQQEAVVSVQEAADRQRAMEEGMQRALQDMDRSAERQAADRAAADRAAADRAAADRAAADRAAADRAAADRAAADRAAADRAAADRAAAREGREAAHEAAAERAQREHFERNIAAADRIHEARAMQGGGNFHEKQKSFSEGGNLELMSFSELLQARADALGLRA